MVTVDTNTVGTAADYATLALWQTGERTNLMTADKIARAAMKDELHTAAFPFSGIWGTDATRYAWIDTENAAARHDGTAGTGARLITNNNIPVIIQTNEHLHVTWLEMADTTPNNNRPCIRINGASGVHLHMDHLILREQGMGFYIQAGADNCTIDLLNTLIYNGNRRAIRFDGTGHTVRIYHTTGWNIARDGATHAGLYVDSPSTTTVDLRNTLLSVDAAADAILLNGAGDPWDPGCDKTILSDASGTGEGLPGDKIESAAFQAGTGGSGTRVMFANLTGGSEDLRLVEPSTRTDNAAIEFGANLTAEVFPENIFIGVDIEGDTRAAVGVWDAGADGTPLPPPVVSVFNTSDAATGSGKFFKKVVSDPVVLGEGAILTADPGLTHCAIGVQMFDSGGLPIVDSTGTFVVEVKTLLSQVWEVLSDSPVDATAPISLSFEGNIDQVRITPASLTDTVTYIATLTCNRN